MKELAFKIGDYELPKMRGIWSGFKPTFDVDSPTPPLGNIISELLKYFFIFAGLLLLLSFISAGFSLLTSAGDPKQAEGAKARLTASVIGFLIVISSWWLIQLLEIIFSLNILK